MSSQAPASLPFTCNAEADALLAADPLALLIGFVLDQQITTIKAFGGPLELCRRAGTLEPSAIGAMDPAELDRLFRQTPALHRFPGTMAKRVQAACAIVAARYGGDASRIWREAASADDLVARLTELPGIGVEKARDILGILVNRYGLQTAGSEPLMPELPSLAYVDSEAALAGYLGWKRNAKAEARAAEKER